MTKTRHGGGYRLEVKAEPTHVDAVQAFVTEAFGALPMERHSGVATFELPRAVSLGGVFSRLEQQRGELRISEYSLSQTTLEQVFLNVAKAAEEQQGGADTPGTAANDVTSPGGIRLDQAVAVD